MGIFLFFILILLVFLLFAPIKLKIDTLKGKKGIFDLKIYFCSFLVYSAIYYIHLRNDIRLHFIQIKKNSFRYIPVKLKAKRRKKIKINQFFPLIDNLKITLLLGTGDAAYTAICCGLTEAIMKSIVQIWQIPHVYFQVKPDFKKIQVDFSFNGIIRFQIAKVINIILKEKRRKYASN